MLNITDNGANQEWFPVSSDHYFVVSCLYSSLDGTVAAKTVRNVLRVLTSSPDLTPNQRIVRAQNTLWVLA